MGQSSDLQNARIDIKQSQFTSLKSKQSEERNSLQQKNKTAMVKGNLARDSLDIRQQSIKSINQRSDGRISNDIRTATSKMMGGDNRSSQPGDVNNTGTGDPISIADQESHRSSDWANQDPLVKFGVDMSELSDYLDNIIKVVNQHAKLLDKVSDELDMRPKATEVGELFSALTLAYPYERTLRQMHLQQHPPRNAKVMEILSNNKVSLTSKLEQQVEKPVDNMWEGMERFMKAVDVFGRSMVELKEFQHSSEITTENMKKQIDLRVPTYEHESALYNLQQKLEAKMNSSFNEFDEKISKLSDKTERRLDSFDAALKKVEADTYWKIKDYEKLLEMRPTMQYVKSTIAEECRETLIKARIYTDDEIEKLKNSAAAIEKTFAKFKQESIIEQSAVRDELRNFKEMI